MALLRAPLSVFLSITYRCNLRCRHCAVYSDDTPYEDLGTGSWLRLFEELAGLKVFRVRLSGGEPLMRKDLWRLMDALHAWPMRLSLNTNATLIGEGEAARLSRYDKMDEVMVSLDGSRPETHDALRGSGAFRAALAGIEALAAAGVPLSFYCTVNRHNRRDLPAVCETARRYGASGIKFNDLLSGGRGLVNYRELALDRRQWGESLRVLRDLRRDYGPFVSGTILDLGDIYDSMASAGPAELRSLPAGPLSGCGALIQECAVRPDGWITPCDRIPGLRAGHIREGRFGEIWRSSAVFTAFRKRREVLLSDLRECRGCSYQGLCTGGCPAAPYALYGEVVARDPSCCYRIYRGQEQAAHVQ